jgi:hypothetical protein
VSSRRRFLRGLLLATVGFAVAMAWRSGAALSHDEQRLVGTWGYRITDPAYQFGTRAGAIRNAWHVHEFAPDHVFRDSIVSGDDAGHRWIRASGQWHVVDGHLRLLPPPDARWRRALTDLSHGVWKATGLVLDSPTQPIGSCDLLFRFPEDGVLELRNADQRRRRLEAMTNEGVPYSLRLLRADGEQREATRRSE